MVLRPLMGTVLALPGETLLCRRAGLCKGCRSAPELSNLLLSPDSSLPNLLLSPKLCSSAPCGRLGILPAARGAAGEEQS